MKTERFLIVCAGWMACAQAVSAQSFNIDIGQPGAGPPANYAAAGQPGQWMSIPATQGVTYSNLVNVDGEQTPVTLLQIGGTATQLVNDPDLTGDDAVLMNDFIITFTPVENCLFLDNLEPGEYEVLIYARMPAQPDILAKTDVDQEPGNPQILVGGPWPGQHEEFISYSKHTAFVAAGGPSAGKLGTHAGVAPGGNLAVGAVMNGIQIRKIEPLVGDLDGDGEVDVDDWPDFAMCLRGPNVGPVLPSCALADANDDDDVDLQDVAYFQAEFGGQ